MMAIFNLLLLGVLFIFSISLSAEEKQPLGAILGAQLIQASKGEINNDNYSNLHFNRCAAIKKHLGFTDDPLGHAIEYSCKGLVIGITLYAGKDLGKHPPEKIAQHFKSELLKYSITSEVFIKHNHKYGSAMAFFINGETYKYDWVRPTEALTFLNALASSARLYYLDNKQITANQFEQWVKGNPPKQIMN